MENYDQTNRTIQGLQQSDPQIRQLHQAIAQAPTHAQNMPKAGSIQIPDDPEAYKRAVSAYRAALIAKGVQISPSNDDSGNQVGPDGLLHDNGFSWGALGKGLLLAGAMAAAPYAVGALAGAGAAGAGGAAAGGAGAAGTAAATGGIMAGVKGAAVPILTSIAKGGISDVLTKAAAGGQSAQQNNDTLKIALANATTNRLQTAASLPGTRLKTSVAAGMTSRATPTKINWGGPGSGLRGEVPTTTGGFHDTVTPTADTKALGDQIQHDQLLSQLQGGPSGPNGGSDMAMPQVGQASTGDSILGGAGIGTSILGSILASRGSTPSATNGPATPTSTGGITPDDYLNGDPEWWRQAQGPQQPANV